MVKIYHYLDEYGLSNFKPTVQMLGQITEKLANAVYKLSMTMHHMTDLFLPYEKDIDVTSKEYATEKYRFQNCLGKLI